MRKEDPTRSRYKIQFRIYKGAFYDYIDASENELDFSEAQNKLEYLRRYLADGAEYRAVKISS